MRRRAGHFASALGLALVLLVCWGGRAFAWSFAVCGDSRDDVRGIFPRILETVGRSDMEFLLHTGDLENTGGKEAWSAFRRRTAGFAKPLYVAIGNHEIRKATRREFADFFGLPSTSYSFTHRDAHVAVLDNAGGEMTDARLDWLDRDLSAHPKSPEGIRYLIVAMHTPPKTDNVFPHGTSSDYGAQSRKLHAILVRHRADLVLCSHEHLHMVDWWDGVQVIISGGAGAPLFPFQKYGFYRIDLEGGRVRETFVPLAPAGEAGPEGRPGGK